MSGIEYKSDNLRLEIDNDTPIARFYIWRPEKLNAISMAMRREIVRFFDLIETDERIRVVVIRGVAEGKGFSAGGDIPQFVMCRCRSSPIWPIRCHRRSAAPSRSSP